MGTTDNSLWIKIQQGLRETEALMNQKQYNMVMIKARQTLEYMIHFLAEKALIVETDLADSIDQLYEGRFISQTVKDHYHRIRVLGNKAVHEGNDSPYDASEACKLISIEVTAFTNAFHKSNQGSQAQKPRTAGVQAAPMASRATSQRTAATADEPRRTGTPQRANSGSSRRAPQSSGSRSGQRPPQGTAPRNDRRPAPQNRSRRRIKNRRSDLSGLIKPLLIFLLLFVVVLIIVKLIPGKDKKNETVPTEISTEVTSEAISTTAEAVTEPAETETEPPKVYTTKSKLNVRSKPASDSTKLGSLASGTVVEYVETYDDKWTVITFEGKQAYVATEFLTVTEGTGKSETESDSETTKAASQ
ncbi:MAG: DUF4145 domain-containing protein [Paenibacillaceae bacterium]|nr:DUF4145 domain-containing protein [Paenibacillaceae bacterium]